MTQKNSVQSKAVRSKSITVISWKLYRVTKNRKYIRKK